MASMSSVALKLTVLLVLLGVTTFAYPSKKQCLQDTKNATIQAMCKFNEKYQATYMPTNKEIYFQTNDTLHVPDPKIPNPYYSLCPFDTHRDARFCKDVVIPNRNRVLMIKRLFGAWLDFTTQFNLKWWVTHGALIGWFYNEDLLPWDSDIDVEILFHDLVHVFSKFDKFVYRERYLVELNPGMYYRGYQEDFIDARFIDMRNGLYVDITAMYYGRTTKKIYCKSPRYYDVEDIFPLRNVTFLGFDNVWFPNDPVRVMEKDYGRKCMEMKKWARPRKIGSETYDIEFYRWSEHKHIFVTDKHPPTWRSVLKRKKSNKPVEAMAGPQEVQ